MALVARRRLDEGHADCAINVVFDGPSGSGKSATLRLVSRLYDTVERSDVVSTEEERGPTRYFDWLRLNLSNEGQEARAHLLTVPGEGTPPGRRRALLDLAHVVVFVVESSPEGITAARARFDDLRARYGEDLRHRVVVQAHKQDLPGALSAAHVAHHLGGRPRVVGTSQTDPAALLAVMRAALRMAIARATPERDSPASDPGTLLRYLSRAEQETKPASVTLIPPSGDALRGMPTRPVARVSAPRHRRSSPELEPAAMSRPQVSGVRPMATAPDRARRAMPPLTIELRIELALERANAIPGAIAVAIVDYESGEILGSRCNGRGFDVATAARCMSQVIRSKMAVIGRLSLDDNLEDMLATTANQHHLMRPLSRMGTLFMLMALRRPEGDLGLARRQLAQVERELLMA